MDLYAHGTGHLYDGHIGSDNGRNTRITRSFKSLPHVLHLSLIDYNVKRKVSFDTVLFAYAHNFRKIFVGEVICRVASHVQVANPEIHGVRPALDSRHQALEVPRRGHYLNLLVHKHLFSATKIMQKKAQP